MTQLAAGADHFAAEVRAVKNDIRSMVEKNIPRYPETMTLPGGFREAAQSRFVNGPISEMVDEVNRRAIGELIDDAGDLLFGDNDNIDNTSLSIDELADVVHQHTVAGDIEVGGSDPRPTRDEIYQAIDLGRREEETWTSRERSPSTTSSAACA